ncbi:MAG: hypothetical protein J5744_06890, partial [Oscillospiraceae bacterium]|nr:hypothetical protein [Oscillospiraceae bacterium]
MSGVIAGFGEILSFHKDGAPDELADDGVVHDVAVLVQHVEELEKVQQALGLGVLRLGPLDSLEEVLGVLFDESYLIDAVRVEEHVRLGVVREYAGVLGGSDLGPQAYGLGGVAVPGPAVADEPAQEPSVGCGDTVMVIYRDRRERGDVYLELVFLR